MTTARQAAGASGNALGKLYEAALEESAAFYRARRFAAIDRHEMPMQAVRSRDGRGRQMFVPKGDGPWDYEGALGVEAGEAGRCVVMEAKHSGGDETSLRIVPGECAGSGLQEHQLRGLVERLDFGCLATVCWVNGDPRDDGAWRGILLPDRLREALAAFDDATAGTGGRKSIPRHWFVGYRVRHLRAPFRTPGGGMVDATYRVEEWLSPLLTGCGVALNALL